jgi:hypothetical protein
MRKRQDYGDDVQVPGFSYSDGGDGGNGIDDVSSAAESLFGNRDDSDTAESENSDDEDVATKKTSAKTPVKKPVKTPVKTPAAEDTDQDASQVTIMPPRMKTPTTTTPMKRKRMTTLQATLQHAGSSELSLLLSLFLFLFLLLLVASTSAMDRTAATVSMKTPVLSSELTNPQTMIKNGASPIKPASSHSHRLRLWSSETF